MVLGKINRNLFWFILLFSINNLTAQVIDHQYYVHYDSSLNLLREFEYEQALDQLFKAKNLSYPQGDYDMILKANSMILRIYASQRKDELIAKIIDNSLQIIDRESLEQSSISEFYYEYIGYLYDKGNLFIARNGLKDIKILAAKDTSDHLVYVKLLLLSNQINQSIGNNSEAEKDLKKSLNLILKKEGGLHPYLTFIYNGLGNLASFNQDYHKAEKYFLKVLDLLKNYPNAQDKSSVYANLSIAYVNLGKLNKAELYANKSIEIDRKLDNFFGIAKSYIELGNIYDRKAKKNSSLFYYDQARLMAEKINGDYAKLILASTLTGEANVYSLHDPVDYERAKQLSIKVLEIYEEVLGLKSEQYLNALVHTINLYVKNHQEVDAIKYAQKALNLVSKEFVSEISLENPDITSISTNNIVHAVNICYQKSIAIRSRLVKNYQYEDVIALKETTDLGIMLIEKWKKTSISKQKDNLLIGDYDYFFQYNIEANSLLRDKENAFKTSEKFRYNNLTRHVYLSEAKSQFKIPENIIESEKDIKNDLHYFKTLLIRNKDSLELKAKVFDYQLKLDSLLNKLKISYPAYYAINYQSKTLSVEEVKSKILSPESVLLEYFIADDSIYVFCVTKNEFRLNVIPKKEDLINTIERISKNLSTNPLHVNQNEKNFDQFVNDANSLYHHLITPVKDLISNKNLIIIPDGKLSLIPFEILLESNETHGYDFKKLPYLIKNHAISYTHSATLYGQIADAPSDQKIKGVLAFAPVFSPRKKSSNKVKSDATRDSLIPLKWTEVEVYSLAEIFDKSTIVYGDNATEKNFLNRANDYQVLHIATHGLLDDKNPMYSKIVFSEDALDTLHDGYLHTYELYNTELSADMVVLSACNTGYGEVIKGEGVVSLANGFFYAGCKSVVMSYWLADDHSTAQIMNSFYEGLSNKLSKSEALQNSKLNYLKNASVAKSHPYYWATFVAYGDIEKITLNKSYEWEWWLLISVICIVSFIILKYYYSTKF